MRSEKQTWEPKSLWTRFGPTALSFAIVGVGVAGALRIVRAEDTPKSVTTTLRAAGQEERAVRNRAEAQLEAATRAAQRAEDVARVSVAQRGDEATERELEALEKQRAALDERIAALRRRARGQGNADALRLRDSLRSNVLTLPRGRELSADEKKAVEEAMKTAQEAMRMAEKAMQEALRAAPRGDNFRFFGGEGGRVIVPSIPAIPAVPKIELKDLPRARVDGKGYFFRSDGANPRVFLFDGKDAKEFQWNSEEWQKEFQAEWMKKQPEFEKQMRELQERMEKWSRDFEARMRSRFREEEEKAKSKKEETTETSSKTETTVRSTSSETSRAVSDYDDIL